jgi:hypothetical protein
MKRNSKVITALWMLWSARNDCNAGETRATAAYVAASIARQATESL